MADALKKVSKGSPLVIPADTFNTFVDAAQDFLQRKQGQAADRRGVALPPGIVIVRNDSEEDQARFAVMVITGVVFDHEDNASGFENGPAFTANKPTGTDGDKIVILTEPIADGRMGRAMITGVTPVQLAVGSEGDTCAKSATDVTATLATGSSGPARILWKESGTGTKWGVVQFPVGGSGGAAMKFAKITGKAGTDPPWRYAAVEVVHDGSAAFSSSNFVAKSGGDTLSWTLVNLQEIGASGAGVNPLLNDSIVAYWPMGVYYACSVSNYRGTY